ncbi:spore germination protein [Priestia aryabhattai]|uniref:spore germination protein n=1 Tax=Priestia aryabhattai TaxID=412384 RepID=UPI003D2BD859
MPSSLLEIYIERIKEKLGSPTDLVIRNLRIKVNHQKVNTALVYIAGIVKEEEIENYIIEPMQQLRINDAEDNIIHTLQHEIIQVKAVTIVKSLEELVKELLKGQTAILVEGKEDILLGNTSMWKERAIGDSTGQRVAKGPLIGFNENLDTNISLLRKCIKSEELRFQKHTLGSTTNTDICLVYLEKTVDKKVLREVNKRLEKINVEKILEANYIEEFISDDFFTPFPLALSTDRPDVVTGEITEGKVAILVEGSPFSLVVPSVLVQFLHAPDDYYTKNGGFLRLFRALSLVLSLYLPALYVAFVNFHPGLLPGELLISLISQREGRPLPLVIEILLFMFLFQIILEAATRLPKELVFVISIVGTIIIGQAAVDAGLVQPSTLLVVSMSYIFSFVSPIITLSPAIRTIRYVFILCSAFLGLYGLILGTLTLLFHLNHLRSFGVPYLSPMSPFNPHDQKDTIFRAPFEENTNSSHQFFHEEPVFKDNTKKGKGE